MELTLNKKRKESEKNMASYFGKFKDKLGNLFYPTPYLPIGFVYISVNNINPGTIFGGTWEQIKDVFLLACGSTYANGTTGGEANHTLTQKELPNYDLKGLKWSNNWPITLDGGTSGSGYKLEYQYGVYNTSQTKSLCMNSGGSGQSHNNMPPYLAVYMWKRVK